MQILFVCLILPTFVARVYSQTQLFQSESQTVTPGSSVKLSCNIFTYTNYWIDWVKQAPGKGLEYIGRIHPDEKTIQLGASFTGRFVLSRVNSQSMVYLQVSSLRTEDTAMYYCARDTWYYGLDYWGQGTLVTVTSDTQSKPSVFPLVSCCGVNTSSQVTIGCLVSGYLPEPVEVTWSADADITTGIKTFPSKLQKSPTGYILSSQLRIPSSDWESKTYQCNVKHKATNTEVTKHLSMAECKKATSKPTVQVFQSSCMGQGGKGAIELVCLISGYSPDTISVQWLKNRKTASLPAYTAPSQKGAQGTFSTNSQVNVSKSDWNSGHTYTCKVNHPATDTNTEDSIRNCQDSADCLQPRVSMIAPNPKDLYLTNSSYILCCVEKMKDSKSLEITWARGGRAHTTGVTSEPVLQDDGTFRVESHLNITSQDWELGEVFTCTVKHRDLTDRITRTISKPEGRGLGPSVYIFPPHQLELNHYEFVSLTCLLKGFRPKDIYVQWKRNDIVVSGSDSLETLPVQENGADGNNTYFLYSKLTIRKSEWARRDTFSCEAVHEALPKNPMQRKIQKSRGK